MKNILTLTYLAIAGVLLVAIGGGILLVPHAFHAGSGIVLGDSPNLLSETRAPGGLLLAAGLVILGAVFREPQRHAATQLSILVYGSYSFARLVSVALDGMPTTSILIAAVLELLVALAGTALLATWRAGGNQNEEVAMVAPHL